MLKVQKTLGRIRFLTYLVMTFVAILLIIWTVTLLTGIEFSYKNGALETLVATDLRPLTDRLMIASVLAIGPVLLLAGGVQVILFTECFTANVSRRLDAAKFARNAGIITIIYAFLEPLTSAAGHLLNISLFIIRRVPWNAAAKENVQFYFHGNVILLSLMLALMFFLVSYMLKVDENVQKKEHFVAAE